jgi:hypothetical protein
MLIFVLFLLSIFQYFARKHRINYIFLFEITPKIKVNWLRLLKHSLLMFFLWGLILIAYVVCLQFFNKLFYDKGHIFAIIIFSTFILYLLAPFKFWFYFYSRTCIIATFMKGFFPFGKEGVKFRDFILADVVTSFMRPIASGIYSICLLYNNNYLLSGIESHCQRTNPVTYSINSILYLVRMFQMCNRYHYTKLAFPHIANIVKYFIGVLFQLFNFLHFLNLVPFWVSLLMGFIAYSYFLYWDYYVDWGIFRFSSKQWFLREKIKFSKSFYYFAIITNFILRYFFILSFYKLPLDTEPYEFILSACEIFRRMLWLLIRVENEHLHNPEKYRTFIPIPDLPLNS